MKDWHRNLLLSFLSLVIVLLILEISTRYLTNPVSRVNFTTLPRSILTKPAYPGVRYTLRPNGSGMQHFGTNPDGYFDPDSTLTYKINSLGFRGKDTTHKKPPGTIRIAVIGDSFTFGIGVRNEHTLPSVLESQLIAETNNRNIEVLNLGVGGYNTEHEVNLLSNFGISLEPDIVIICFFLNDTNAGRTAKAFGKWTPENQLPLWRRYSRLIDIFASRFERQSSARELAVEYKTSYENDSPGWIKSRNSLKEAILLSKKHGFALYLVIYPVLWSLSDDYPFQEIHKTISNYAASLGIPVLDLQPAFRGFDGPELWAHPNNQHPNAKAHLIAAQALSKFIMSKYPQLTVK